MVVAILAIIVGVGMPSFTSAMDERRVIGAVDVLLSDIRYAQSEAVKRNTTVSIVFTTGSSWSYTVNTTPSKSTNGTDYSGTSLTSTFDSNTINFSPKRGTITQTLPAYVGITSAKGKVLRVEVDALSQPVACTTTSTGSYPACTQ